MIIDLMIPTRERPQLALRTAQSALKTCDEKDRLRIFIGIDHDDPKIEDYRQICADNGISLLVSPTSGSVPRCVDWMWRQTEGDILVLGTDDVIFRTQGWDRFLQDKFTRQPYLVISPNDGRNRRKLEQPIITRKWAELVGKFFAEFHHFCADEWLEQIAVKSGLLAFCMEITMEHMHPKYGKGEWDDVYKRKRNEQGQLRAAEDREKLRACAGEIEEAAIKLCKAASKYEVACA